MRLEKTELKGEEKKKYDRAQKIRVMQEKKRVRDRLLT